MRFLRFISLCFVIIMAVLIHSPLSIHIHSRNDFPLRDKQRVKAEQAKPKPNRPQFLYPFKLSMYHLSYVLTYSLSLSQRNKQTLYIVNRQITLFAYVTVLATAAVLLLSNSPIIKPYSYSCAQQQQQKMRLHCCFLLMIMMIHSDTI